MAPFFGPYLGCCKRICKRDVRRAPSFALQDAVQPAGSLCLHARNDVPAPGTVMEPGPAGPAAMLPDAVVSVPGADACPHHGVSFTVPAGTDTRRLSIRSRWQADCRRWTLCQPGRTRRPREWVLLVPRRLLVAHGYLTASVLLHPKRKAAVRHPDELLAAFWLETAAP